MSLSTDFLFEIFNSDGNMMSFTDITPAYSVNTPEGYGAPNIARSAITQTRILFLNYPASIAETTLAAGETLVQYRQYLKTAGSSQVYDNKTVVVGNFFIPPITGLTVATGDEFLDTGVYVPYIAPASFLPTTNTTSIIFTIPEVGLSSDYDVVPDIVFDLQYEVYGATVAAPFTSVEGMRYIVKGASGTALYTGNTYRIGECFVGDGSSQVTVSGAATIAALQCMSEKTIVTTYNIEDSAYELNITALEKRCGCSCDPQLAISSIYNIIKALQYQTYTNAVSFEKATGLIRLAESKINNLNACF